VRIAAPVTLITGGASEPFYEPIADELARRIPGATRIRLDRLTHTTPITDPSAVVDTILAALAARTPTPAHDALEPAR
jgi:pimeloyl-ACP methyl ester carboxylesterase